MHRPSTMKPGYIPRDTAATMPQGLVTPPLDQALNRVFSGFCPLQHVRKTLVQLWSQTSVLCVGNLE